LMQWAVARSNFSGKLAAVASGGQTAAAAASAVDTCNHR